MTYLHNCKQALRGELNELLLSLGKNLDTTMDNVYLNVVLDSSGNLQKEKIAVR